MGYGTGAKSLITETPKKFPDAQDATGLSPGNAAGDG